MKSKIEKLKEEIVRLNEINERMMAGKDKQISLTDPDARSMATSGKDTGIVGYNVQVAVDRQHHLIVAHAKRERARRDKLEMRALRAAEGRQCLAKTKTGERCRRRGWANGRCGTHGGLNALRMVLQQRKNRR